MHRRVDVDVDEGGSGIVFNVVSCAAEEAWVATVSEIGPREGSVSDLGDGEHCGVVDLVMVVHVDVGADSENDTGE